MYLTVGDLMDCSLPGCSVHGIFQARVLEWGAISFSRGPSWPRDRTQVSCIVGRRFTVRATRGRAPLYCLILKLKKKLYSTISEIVQYCPLSDLSSVRPSRSIHTVANGKIFFFPPMSEDYLIVWYTHIFLFLYSFIHQWILGCFHVTAVNTRVQISVCFLQISF